MSIIIPKFFELRSETTKVLRIIFKNLPYSSSSFKRDDIKSLRDIENIKDWEIQKGLRELVEKNILKEDRERKPFEYSFKYDPKDIKKEFHKQLDEYLGLEEIEKITTKIGEKVKS